MKNNYIKCFLFIIFISFNSWAVPADWSKGVEISSPRENLYQLNPEAFHNTVMEGRRHALFYPVQVTELLIPYRPLKTFFESRSNDRVRRLLYELTKIVSPFQSMEELYSWLGLNDFPRKAQPENPNPLPHFTREEMALPMGATLIKTSEGEALTFGCAACHTADLFGVKVIGLTNRFPRANEFFRKGSMLAPYVNTFVFKEMLNTTEGERLMLAHSKRTLKFVGVKEPKAVGLDTSLAQVALSLAKREPDAWATKTSRAQRRPRSNKLEKMVADSKPAVWWNVKYKNRWLSDGSIVSGNPVHTNFLWNEIGRGAELKQLEQWMDKNQNKIEALTAAVFASRSPRYEDFFGPDSIDIEKAKRGESHFIQSCKKCHGVYEKGWNSADSTHMNNKELIQTTKVTYHKQTPVKDVGTDPGRYLGMNYFAADLNRLTISKSLNAVVEPQKGYVPPPLDGIWARWPYFHNNSIPNLCVLLTRSAERPKFYWPGPAINKNTDYDQECGGYPLGNKTPVAWKKQKEFFYDNRLEGLSNQGHDERIFLQDGKEIYTWEEKLELIEFLKTL